MPIFKKNLDLQQNQLLNPVLHKLPVMPNNPVEGQVYYDTGKRTAYLWNGSNWAVWGETPSTVPDIKQYMLNIPNPTNRQGLIFVRLFQNQEVIRIDSHLNAQARVGFNIESRQRVNERGDPITHDPILASYEGTETREFSTSFLPADNWLYLDIVEVGGTVGLLTITITCITR